MYHIVWIPKYRKRVLKGNIAERLKELLPQLHRLLSPDGLIKLFDFGLVLDAEGRYEIGQEVLPVDALKFKDSRKYPERLQQAMNDTGETDALVAMGGSIRRFSTDLWQPTRPSRP